MKLTNPTDDQLDAAFADRVARLELCPTSTGMCIYQHVPGAKAMYPMPRFTRSADAVLPWLEKWETHRFLVQMCGPMYSDQIGMYRVSLHDAMNGDIAAEADTFPRAAVLALLRAHGVEVEFTKETEVQDRRAEAEALICKELGVSSEIAHRLVNNGLCSVPAFEGTESRDFIDMGFNESDTLKIMDGLRRIS